MYELALSTLWLVHMLLFGNSCMQCYLCILDSLK